MEKNDNLKVVYKNIDEITPYKNNPRKNDNAVEYVKNSIKDFGFKVPVVIDKDNIVVAGHTRLKAAKELNLDRIPCIVADDLTEGQIKAFRLADNKVSEFSEWDLSLLDSEFKELSEMNLDFNMLDFGFEDSNLFEDEENEKDNLDTEYQQLYDKTVIAIEFDTEEKLEAAFTKLTDEGYKCQILTL